MNFRLNIWEGLNIVSILGFIPDLTKARNSAQLLQYKPTNAHNLLELIMILISQLLQATEISGGSFYLRHCLQAGLSH
jgi:hypothetical protein